MKRKIICILVSMLLIATVFTIGGMINNTITALSESNNDEKNEVSMHEGVTNSTK